MTRRRQSTKLIELKSQAKREGWLKWLRVGEGEEADEKALLNGCVFDQRRADHVVEYFETYGTLTEGPWKGEPFNLLDWQADWLQRLFGWSRFEPEWETWVRRFRYAYLEVPKENGKTPMLATLGNYLLVGDSYGRQINQYLAATTRKQAERCIVHAKRQVELDEDLAAEVTIRKLEGFTQLSYGDNEWQVVAADPDSVDGVNGHCLADELHRWKGDEFFNSLRYMLASQPEGLFVAITTAGNDPSSVCRRLHDKTKQINAGRNIEQDFFGKIYGLTSQDDPHKVANWKKANPSLGTNRAAPLKLSTFRADYEAAKLDPTLWATFLQLRLGIWRSAVEGWLDDLGGLESWDAGKVARQAFKKTKKRKRLDCYSPFRVEDLEAEDCYAGFDGATVRDTTSLVLAFPDPEVDELVRVVPWFWLPRKRAEQLQEKVPYRQWAELGHITLTDGDAVDFDRVFEDVCEIFERFNVLSFHFDPLFQAEWITRKIEDETGVERIEFPQTTMFFSPTVKTAERLIIERKILHNGNPVLTSQIANAKVFTDKGGNKRIIKQQHGEWRAIDGVVAMLMSLREAFDYDAGDFYDDNEVESC